MNYGRSHAIEQMRMMRATQEQRAMLQQAARARNAASASRDRPNDLARYVFRGISLLQVNVLIDFRFKST